MPRGAAVSEAAARMPDSLGALVAALARALTLVRFAAVVPFAWLLRGDGGPALAVLFAAVALSDFLDGKLARLAGVASARWGLVDAAADVVFNFVALACAASLGVVGWWVPAAMGTLGGRFLLRSFAAPAIRYDGAGNLAGVLYYVVVGGVVLRIVLGIPSAWIVARSGDGVFLYTLFALARASSLARPSAKSSA